MNASVPYKFAPLTHTEIWSMMKGAPLRAHNMTDSPVEKAFREAFEEFSDPLFRHALYRVSDRERAADLTQETFLKAWDYVREGKEIHYWKSFLYRILHNLIIDEYRRRKEESLDALTEKYPAGPQNELATGDRAEKEDALDTEFAIVHMRTLIARLPEAQRVVISLRYVDGFSPKEIAAFLDISENVTSVRIHRGLTKLKEWYGPTDSP